MNLSLPVPSQRAKVTWGMETLTHALPALTRFAVCTARERALLLRARFLTRIKALVQLPESDIPLPRVQVQESTSSATDLRVYEYELVRES